MNVNVNVNVHVHENRKQPSITVGRFSRMQLDHERLEVYDLALEFVVQANGIIESLPKGRAAIADQLTRASLSIVLNLAEGAGKQSQLDKRRYYLTSKGSATESAALLDVCLKLNLLDTQSHESGKNKLVRIVSMLFKLARSCESEGRVGAQR